MDTPQTLSYASWRHKKHFAVTRFAFLGKVESRFRSWLSSPILDFALFWGALSLYSYFKVGGYALNRIHASGAVEWRSNIHSDLRESVAQTTITILCKAKANIWNWLLPLNYWFCTGLVTAHRVGTQTVPHVCPAAERREYVSQTSLTILGQLFWNRTHIYVICVKYLFGALRCRV